ncbi:MAG: AAA-like domain-containing protein [Lachnospiraceae bacterium]|nr:AAA-like domain-containing protein [Lachnospiraceae bacterium]MBQ3973699.1 AAA-like domain-containing protein [Lachnospiraceae bacterium]MBQ4303300.1 AAA-like domain-containing protein [Lachnospiraceae bacterium]MBQ5359933.1 AAA-like domain-containing protein [Lachnospiraceae bacterium]
MKKFNTTAVCIPSKHYMVDLTDRIREIGKMVDAGEYFAINRARQYGKTTTLNLLKKYMSDKYDVINLDFQGIGDAGYKSEQMFVKAFCRQLKKKPANYRLIPDEIKKQFEDFLGRKDMEAALDELFIAFSEWCNISEKPVVLIIDEVDSATNNQVFLDFLAQLRDGYISRETDDAGAFQSVILAGVTDIRYLRTRIRPEDQHKMNSPWNIASDFDIDMSLSETGIKGMLDEYEADHKTGMDTSAIAKLLREYTNGYPFLVSRICQLIDEEVGRRIGLKDAWTSAGFDEAVKLLLAENNTLFQSLTKNLNNLPELKASIRSILMEGTRLTWNGQQDAISIMQMYGLIRNEHNTVKIANRIFETLLYNLFLSDEEFKNNAFSREGDLAKNIFVKDGCLDVRMILEGFIRTYHQIFGQLEDRFPEKDGRELFLLYLKPIINGTGNYYIEAQTRDQKRTDVIIDYLGRQYIIEMKLWRGERYNAEGEKQICEYLDYFGLSAGYMLSFNFNRKKETGVRRVEIGNKVLYEGTV